MALLWLSDETWAVIRLHLPKNWTRTLRVDDPRVISSIVHVLNVGRR